MISEVVHPIIKEMPLPEQRKLLVWLQSQLKEQPILEVKKTNTKLRNKLIKHIQKNK